MEGRSQTSVSLSHGETFAEHCSAFCVQNFCSSSFVICDRDHLYFTMSYCKEDGKFNSYVLKTFDNKLLGMFCLIQFLAGKDRLIFVTAEDHSTPSSVKLPEDDDDEEEGLIKANGEINWDCPCLQGMAYGPCGDQFRSAFSCFHYSEAEVKGSDCIEQFRDMQQCFVKYPEIYGKDDEEEEKRKEQENTDNSSEKETEKLNEKEAEKLRSEVEADSMNSEQASASPSRAVIAAQVNDQTTPFTEGKEETEQDTNNN